MMYISNHRGHTIIRIDQEDNHTVIAGTGADGAVDGGPGVAQLSYPWGIITDADGNVYVGGYFDHAIRKVTVAEVGSGSGDTADSGDSQADPGIDIPGLIVQFDGAERVKTDAPTVSNVEIGAADTPDASNYPNAVKFDKDNYNESISYANDGAFNGVHTVSMWFKMDSSLTGNIWLFGMRDSTSSKRYSVHTKDGSTGFGIYSTGFDEFGSDWNPDNWNHLVVVLDTSGTTFYLNGDATPIGSSSNRFLDDVSTRTMAFDFGSKKNEYLNEKFSGYMSDMRVYNRALTANEIGVLYRGEDSVSMGGASAGDSTVVAIDTDGDGVNDDLDAFPTDDSRNKPVLSVLTLTDGTQVLQLEGVSATQNAGGLPVNDTRSLYFHTSDTSKAPTYGGSDWPYVTIGQLPDMPTGVTINHEISDGIYVINDRPVYQYAADASDKSADGIIGDWRLVGAHGMGIWGRSGYGWR